MIALECVFVLWEETQISQLYKALFVKQ